MPTLKYPTRPRAKKEAVVGGDGHLYRFTILAPGVLRYEYASDGQFEDRASTLAINRDQPVPKFRLIDNE